MKRVEAVIKCADLDAFKEAAANLGVFEFDVSEVRRSPGVGFQERRRLYRGQEFTVDLLSRLKVEFVVFDDDAKAIVHALLELLRPESVAIFKIDEVVRMGTRQKQTARCIAAAVHATS